MFDVWSVSSHLRKLAIVSCTAVSFFVSIFSKTIRVQNDLMRAIQVSFFDASSLKWVNRSELIPPGDTAQLKLNFTSKYMMVEILRDGSVVDRLMWQGRYSGGAGKKITVKGAAEGGGRFPIVVDLKGMRADKFRNSFLTVENKLHVRATVLLFLAGNEKNTVPALYKADITPGSTVSKFLPAFKTRDPLKGSKKDSPVTNIHRLVVILYDTKRKKIAMLSFAKRRLGSQGKKLFSIKGDECIKIVLLNTKKPRKSIISARIPQTYHRLGTNVRVKFIRGCVKKSKSKFLSAQPVQYNNMQMISPYGRHLSLKTNDD